MEMAILQATPEVIRNGAWFEFYEACAPRELLSGPARKFRRSDIERRGARAGNLNYSTYLYIIYILVF